MCIVYEPAVATPWCTVSCRLFAAEKGPKRGRWTFYFSTGAINLHFLSKPLFSYSPPTDVPTAKRFVKHYWGNSLARRDKSTLVISPLLTTLPRLLPVDSSDINFIKKKTVRDPQSAWRFVVSFYFVFNLFVLYNGSKFSRLWCSLVLLVFFSVDFSSTLLLLDNEIPYTVTNKVTRL